MNMALVRIPCPSMLAAEDNSTKQQPKGRFMITSVMTKSVALALLIAATASSAMAQSGPSREEQMACRSDAGKFCAEHIGKPPAMNACLRANKASLSDSCRKVVESRGG